MNYNLKVSMELIRGGIHTQIEVSSIGRAGRKVFNSPDFKTAIEELGRQHDEMLGNVTAYHQAPVPDPVKQEVKPAAKEPRRKQGSADKA